eukprot:250850-Amphidinium_carterae.1
MSIDALTNVNSGCTDTIELSGYVHSSARLSRSCKSVQGGWDLSFGGAPVEATAMHRSDRTTQRMSQFMRPMP